MLAEVKLLGHVNSKTGVSDDPGKIKVALDSKRPITIIEVMSFLEIVKLPMQIYQEIYPTPDLKLAVVISTLRGWRSYRYGS